MFEDEETQREYDQWIRTQSPAIASKSTTKNSNAVNNIVNKVSNVTGSPGGAATLSGGDAYAASKIAEAWDGWLFKPGSFSRALECDLGGLYAASKVTKAFGILAVAGLVVGVWDNFANYKHGLARSIVDTIVFAGCALIGLGLATVGAPVVLGAAVTVGVAALLTFGGNAIKKTWFGDRKD